MSDKLLPCPSCGEVPAITYHDGVGYLVSCVNSWCGAFADTGICDTAAGAIDAWNKRAIRAGEHK